MTWRKQDAQYYICSVTGSDDTGDGSMANPWQTFDAAYPKSHNDTVAIRGVFNNPELGYRPGRIYGESFSEIRCSTNHNLVTVGPGSNYHFFGVKILGGNGSRSFNFYAGCVLIGVNFSSVGIWIQEGETGVRVFDSQLSFQGFYCRNCEFSNSFLYGMILRSDGFGIFHRNSSVNTFFHISDWTSAPEAWKDHTFDSDTDTFRIATNPTIRYFSEVKPYCVQAFGQTEAHYFQNTVEDKYNTVRGFGEVNGGNYEPMPGYGVSPFLARELPSDQWRGYSRNIFAPAVISRETDKNYFDTATELESLVPPANEYSYPLQAFVKKRTSTTSIIQTPVLCFDTPRQVGKITSLFQGNTKQFHFISEAPMWEQTSSSAAPFLSQNTWYVVMSGTANYEGNTYFRGQSLFYTSGTISGTWTLGEFFTQNATLNYGLWHSHGNVKKSPGALLKANYWYVSETEYNQNPTKAAAFYTDSAEVWNGPGDVIELWEEGFGSSAYHIFPLNEVPMVNTDTGDETGNIIKTNFDSDFDPNTAVPLYAAAIRVHATIHVL